MAITQAICSSFLVELAVGTHNFTLTTGDVFKVALYTSSATLSSATTAYSATNEVVGAGYVAGGATLVNVTPVLSGTTMIIDFADASWAASTITARGALIYNSTDANRSVCVLDFGSDKSSVAQTFTLVFPPAAAATALIRIA